MRPLRLGLLTALVGLALTASAAVADEPPCPNATGAGVYVCTAPDGTPYIQDEVTPGGADRLLEWTGETWDLVTPALDRWRGEGEACAATAGSTSAGLQSGQYAPARCAGFAFG